KMIEPSYRDLQPTDIPHVTLDDGRAIVRVLAGEVAGVKGPGGGGNFERDTAPIYLDVELAPNGSVDLPIPKGHQAFVYPFDGDVVILSSLRSSNRDTPPLRDDVGDKTLTRGELGVLSEGDHVRLNAAPKASPQASRGARGSESSS